MASALEVYERIKARLGEDESRLLLEFVQDAGARGVATREDIIHSEANLRTEIANVEANLRSEIANLDLKISGVEATLRSEIADVAAKLRVEIAQVKVDLIKWLFLFWVGQIAVIAGLIRLLR